MNPLLASFLAGLLRQALAGVAVYFVAHGYFTESEMANYLAAFITAAISVLWMGWVKLNERWKLLSALSLDTPMTEARLESAMASTPEAVPSASTPKSATPVSPVAHKLMALVLAVGLGVSGAAGCASANTGLARAEDRIHDAIAAIDDRVRAECPAPTDLKHVLAEVCQEARKEVEATRKVGQEFTQAALDRKLSTLGPLIRAVGELQQASVKGFNALMQTEIVRLIKQIIDAASDLSMQTKGATQ